MSTVKIGKNEIRFLVKEKLKSIGLEEIKKQSTYVFNILRDLPEFKSAKRVAVYMNMPSSEIQTLDIVRHCFECNKELYLPKCNSIYKEGRKRNYLSMLKMESYNEVLNLKPQGKFKLLEPQKGIDIMDVGGLDLVILPGVAFDSQKNRIGHGAGFYDEFLNHYANMFHKVPSLIGVGLYEQLVQQVPIEPHDWALDKLIIGNLGVVV